MSPGPRIVALDSFDIRFPTSIQHDGSDAMKPDPDYSAAYVILRTDHDGLASHASCVTSGGNDVVVAAIQALAAARDRALRPRVDFVSVSGTTADRVLEYVDHLHEHLADPVQVSAGRYVAPASAGFTATLRPDSLRDHEFPRGANWRRLGGGYA